VRKNLVVARVGRKSLHGGWVAPRPSRNWDLYLSPYEPINSQSGLDCFVGDVIPGPKWSGLRQVLHEWEGWRQYEYIWLPDDDIEASQEVISALFDVASSVGLQLFAPALDETSFYGTSSR